MTKRRTVQDITRAAADLKYYRALLVRVKNKLRKAEAVFNQHNESN